MRRVGNDPEHANALPCSMHSLAHCSQPAHIETRGCKQWPASQRSGGGWANPAEWECWGCECVNVNVTENKGVGVCTSTTFCFCLLFLLELLPHATSSVWRERRGTTEDGKQHTYNHSAVWCQQGSARRGRMSRNADHVSSKLG